ncbi:hypothetical protein ACIQCN_05425 [Pseudarthrobacter sp. NPDC092424]|uniref:hypothetical protein n=1 Tax=Pseudarthrobacter sp. NPDC092424 TaxID=3364415 RepID=UPI00382A9B4C
MGDDTVWIVGDDSDCVLIDPAHDADAVAAAVRSRTFKAILLTRGHGHGDSTTTGAEAPQLDEWIARGH